MLMPEAWERFLAEWQRAWSPEGASDGAAAAGGTREAVAGALRAAEREVFHHLRHDLNWSLIHSHLLAIELARAAERWAESREDDGEVLGDRLRAVWDARRDVRAEEERRCRVTGGALAGVPCSEGAGNEACSPAWAGEHVFELYI